MTIIPQTEYSDSKYILEQLETLIESAQMGIDCTNPSNADAYAALVHVRAFTRGERVHDEPNPVSLPDILQRAEQSLETISKLAMRLTQVLELFDAHDLLWEIRDEAGARAAREIVSAARELVGKV